MKASITQRFGKVGQKNGVPCVFIEVLEDAKDLSINEVVTEVLEYRGRVAYVAIVGRLVDDGEIVQLVKVLAEGGFKVTLYTDVADDITSVWYIKSISFSMSFVFPSDEIKRMYHASLNALREGDEIVVSTEDKNELEFAIKALKEKMFTRPELIFLVPEEMNKTIMKNKFTCGIRVIN